MFYIWEAAVNDFDGVPVEDFAQFVALGEVLVDQGEEDFGNIGGYIDVEEGIKPCDFAFSCFVFIARYRVMQRMLYFPKKCNVFLLFGSSMTVVVFLRVKFAPYCIQR